MSLPDYPHSVPLRDGEIFIAQSSGLYRAPYRTGQARLDPDGLSLLAALPGGGGHSSRTVRVGPDRRVYVSLGISGNCSDEYLDASYPFSQRRGGVLVLANPALNCTTFTADFTTDTAATLRAAGTAGILGLLIGDIFGAGAIGGYMGARLAKAGAEVSLVARGPHLAAMQANGLRLIEEDGEMFRFRPGTNSVGS